MDRKQMEDAIARHGLTLDGWHAGAGLFRDLEIGTGAPVEKLYALREDILAAGASTAIAGLSQVTNPAHPDHGKTYLEVLSFWWE